MFGQSGVGVEAYFPDSFTSSRTSLIRSSSRRYDQRRATSRIQRPCAQGFDAHSGRGGQTFRISKGPPHERDENGSAEISVIRDLYLPAKGLELVENTRRKDWIVLRILQCSLYGRCMILIQRQKTPHQES